MKRLFCSVLCAAALLCGCSNASGSPSSSPVSSAVSAQTETTATATDAATGGLRPNTLKPENFSDDGTFKHYESDTVSAVSGIDVSSYSGDIDWNRVKNAGISFVMVRLGGRGYGDDGALYSDDRAVEYLRGAQEAGLHTGGYFFSQAVSEEEAREEAAYCKELLGDLTLDYPIAYDWEFIKDDTARTDGLRIEQTTACARAFCDTVKTYGWLPMLYAGDAEMTAKYDMNRLADCEIWFCEYTQAPSFPYEIGMWQYSKTAVIDGIEGNVDLNMRFLGNEN